ncbi:MAG: hypothetical protein ACJ8GJ_06130, partial [Vitreoscilla sp.]
MNGSAGILASSRAAQASNKGGMRRHLWSRRCGTVQRRRESARFGALIEASRAPAQPRLGRRKGVQAMPMVTPTLNLPLSTTPSKAATAVAAAAPVAPTAPVAKLPDTPSTTVTLSPQAMNALAASEHAPPSPSPATSSPMAPAAPPPAAHDGSVYESLKDGISTAVADVGGAISTGAHAVVEGVETTLSTANKVATGILELPFAAVAKACDAAGALIDEL